MNLKILLQVVAVCEALGAVVQGVDAQTWQPTGAPGIGWRALACSADGTKLAATAWSAGIYTSTDGGATWTSNSLPCQNWNAIACSADGTKLLAASYPDYPIYTTGVYTSTNAGATWAQVTGLSQAAWWGAVAVVADGSALFAAFAQEGGIYRSTNSGATWERTGAPAKNWSAVASSADGTRLAGLALRQIFTSTNAGVTWLEATNAPSGYWQCLALSADGTKLLAGLFGGGIYTSTDSGATWISNSVPSELWSSVAASADGTKLVAVADCNRATYTSTNGGLLWTSNALAPNNLSGVVSSADGNRLAAISTTTALMYTAQTVPTPTLCLAPANGALRLAWGVPSLPFVLQENSNVAMANWTDVTNTPTFDPTTLQNQVFLEPSAQGRFYRLISRW